MFQIDGRDVLFSWLGKEGDPQRRLGMLEWMTRFASNPLEHAHRVPSIAAPVYVVEVPLRPPVVLTFLYAFHFHAVKLISIKPLP